MSTWHVWHSSDKIAKLSIYLIVYLSIYLSIYTLSALETDVISVHKEWKEKNMPDGRGGSGATFHQKRGG